MKLALVVDMPRTGSKVTAAYTKRVVGAVSAMTGVSVDTVEVPAVPTFQPDGKVPPIAMLRQERAGLMERLASERPDAVVSLGAAALNALNGGTGSVALKNEHGRMRWLDVCDDDTCEIRVPWTPTIAPFQVVRSSDLHRDFANVIYKAVTQLAPLPPADVETVVVTDAASLSDALTLLEGAGVVGVDVETGGLSPYRDELLAVGIGAISDVGEDGAAYGYSVVVPREALLLPEVQDLLWDAVWRRSRRSVGHNFKFDLQFMKRLIEWAPDNALVGDTLLLQHLLDERPNRPTSRARGSGLKDLVAQRYDYQYGFDFEEFYSQTREALPTDETDAERKERIADAYARMHRYLGDDCAYTARLWHDLVRDAEEEGSRVLETHDSLLMPAAMAVARAEYAGAPVDVPWVEDEVAGITRRIARRRAVLEEAVKRLAITIVVDNVMAPGQIADLMYDDWGWSPDVRKHGRLVEGDRSTDQDHIKAAIAKYSKSPHEIEQRRVRWLTSLQRLRKDDRLLKTYQKSVLDRVDDDGRLRASFLLHGASTGRLSSREPNLQNVPAVDDRSQESGRWRYKIRDGSWVHRPMRRAFAATPGRVWVEVDYSQLELRVAAGISGDAAFIEVFTSGRDVHREVASAIFSREPDAITKPERYLAKAVSFGILYGRTAEALAGGAEMDYAERELGTPDQPFTRWTEEVAQAFIRKFLKSYPRLEEWISEVHQTAPVQGYVETPHGRRRRFPLAPSSRSELKSIQRQAVNTPIQAAASDICIEAFAAISREIPERGLDAVALFPVHDSICLDVREDQIGEVEAMCKEIMEKDWMGVPLTVDFEWGPNWADVVKHANDDRTWTQGEKQSSGAVKPSTPFYPNA